MHVLYLNPNGQLGGAEAALLEVLASIREAEPDWTLDLIVAGDGPLALKAGALGVRTTVLPFPRLLASVGDAASGGPAGKQVGRLRLLVRSLLAAPGMLGYNFRLQKAIAGLQPDLIHTNGFKLHVLGALAKPARVPLVWHIHDYVSTRPLMARLISFFQRRCALVLANSNSVRVDVESVCGESLRVQTLYNAVDTTVFSPAGERVDLDQLAGLPPADVIRVGLVATFARWKGHEVFLRALSLIPADVPLRGYIIGGPVYQTAGSQYSVAELQSLARELELIDRGPSVANRVGFTGFVDQPAPALRALDIVVHASTEPEPFGLVIAEAMACGRPVIVSNAGGVRELIEPGANALAHSPGDAAQLAEQITLLAADSELRTRLGEAGRASVERRFTRSRLVSELIPIYQSVVAQIGN